MRDHSHEREVAVRGRSEGLKRRRCGGRVEEGRGGRSSRTGSIRGHVIQDPARGGRKTRPKAAALLAPRRTIHGSGRRGSDNAQNLLRKVRKENAAFLGFLLEVQACRAVAAFQRLKQVNREHRDSATCIVGSLCANPVMNPDPKLRVALRAFEVHLLRRVAWLAGVVVASVTRIENDVGVLCPEL